MSRNHNNFIMFLTEQFKINISSGLHNRLINKDPDKNFYVGNLSPKNQENFNINDSSASPSSIGMEFFLDTDLLEEEFITIEPSGDLYYKTYPSFQEQKEYILSEFSHFGDTIDKILEYIDEHKISFRQPIAPVYEKISISNMLSLPINIKEVINKKNIVVDREIKENIEELIRQAKKDKKIGYKLDTSFLSKDTLKSKELYQDALDKALLESDEIPIYWDFKLIVELKELNNQYRVKIQLVNSTDIQEDNRKFIKGKGPTKIYSSQLYNSGLKVSFSKSLKFNRVKMKSFLNDYKYDTTTRVIGINCNVSDKINYFETELVPIYIEKRRKTIELEEAKFNKLIDDPIKALDRIHKYLLKENQKFIDDFDRLKSTFTEDAVNAYKKELKSMTMEIKRFSYGIEIMKKYNEVRNAFLFMNMTFKNSSSFDSWRLFQIVFIVSLIPDIVCQEYKGFDQIPNQLDLVDLLYFPTGGGKTEAFLGITVFTLFFDRLRGKHKGVSSMIKYPLRLLSVQQVERVSKILSSAELIKSEQNIVGDRFSLGYFVGSNNTPNKLKNKDVELIESSTQQDLNDKYLVIDKCPYCSKPSVYIAYNCVNHTLEHRCSTEGCSSNGKIPLYIIDDEIYRYTPSVIVTTLDKIAIIGQQKRFRHIFGDVNSVCKIHGNQLSDVCELNNIKCEFDTYDVKDPAPTLIIQDEVHLTKESLGTFSSHYEGLLEYWVGNLISKPKKIKFICATATISMYELQMLALFNKQAIRFPAESPNIKRDFYSYTDESDISRVILGFSPFGVASANAMVYTLKAYREILDGLMKKPKTLIDANNFSFVNEREVFNFLQDYWITIQYNNVKRDSNKILAGLQSPINNELKVMGIKEFDTQYSMTGDDDFQTVRGILSKIENQQIPYEGINFISATSMISHGVDAKRFNNIFFFGIPNTMAEYIQAYSRVGRKYPGLVIDLIRPTRERDMSYLTYFNKFHEYKDILVTPVPIERWAYKAIEKTFTGVLSALFVNYFDYKFSNLKYKMDEIYDIKVCLNNNLITIQEVTDIIKKVYYCEDLKGKNYELFIEDYTSRFFDEIKSRSFPKSGCQIYNEFEKLIGLSRPMNSLRDSEDPIIITMGEL